MIMKGINIVHFLKILVVLHGSFCAGPPSSSYFVHTLDDKGICNETIFFDGHKSAAILKLTSKAYYDTNPLFCTVTFMAPMHTWSGLTGVIEEVDLRRYDDTNHHLGQSLCVDHIKLETETLSSGPNHEQCGTWSVSPGDHLSKVGHKRALVGYCPRGSVNAKKCQVTKLKVVISIGREKQEHLWRNYSWGFHKGFTIIVTAYSYPTQNGETECRDGLKSCSQGEAASNLGENHCIHESLWCDGHVNCGIQEKIDEFACFNHESWGEIFSVIIGPWLGGSFLLVLIIGGCIYSKKPLMRWWIAKFRNRPSTTQDMFSYAESYELSSNVSSAHHMAIQVRVVCNSNHPHYNHRKPDLPPAYDSLFPGGPPETCTATPNMTASIIATVEGASAVGVNVTSVTTSPAVGARTRVSSGEAEAAAATSSSSTSHPHVIVSTKEEDPIRSMSPLRRSNGSDVTSIIDLNVIQNGSSPSGSQVNQVERSGGNGLDATLKAGSSQTSVTVTVTPKTQALQPCHSKDQAGMNEKSSSVEAVENISEISHQGTDEGERSGVAPEVAVSQESNTTSESTADEALAEKSHTECPS